MRVMHGRAVIKIGALYDAIYFVVASTAAAAAAAAAILICRVSSVHFVVWLRLRLACVGEVFQQHPFTFRALPHQVLANRRS